MGDFDGVKIGVCTAQYTPPGSGAVPMDLGLTAGGVLFKYSSKWHEIKVDQYGDTIADAALVGESVSVRIPMAETTVAKIKMAIPSSKEIVAVADPTKSKLELGARPGLRASDLAGKLVLHPISSGTSKADDITIFKAIVLNSDIELPFKVDNERILQVDFQGIIDRSKTDGNLLATIGDDAIV